MTRDETICSFIEHYCVQLPTADQLCIYHSRVNQCHLKSKGAGLYTDIWGIWERLGLLQAQIWEKEPSAA